MWGRKEKEKRGGAHCIWSGTLLKVFHSTFRLSFQHADKWIIPIFPLLSLFFSDEIIGTLWRSRLGGGGGGGETLANDVP